MSIVQEFREFAVKGNMIDLAVGVIIGGAFGKIVDSLVKERHHHAIDHGCDWWWCRFHTEILCFGGQPK